MRFLIKNVENFNDEFYYSIYNELNRYQKRKINKLTDIRDKKMSLLGMFLVALELNVSVKEIHYYRGNPYVNINSFFSITHKYPYVGIVIDNNPVGIDLEVLRDIDNNTLKYLKSNNSIEALIKWTRIECKYKINKDICKLKTIIIDKNIILSISYINEEYN